HVARHALALLSFHDSNALGLRAHPAHDPHIGIPERLTMRCAAQSLAAPDTRPQVSAEKACECPSLSSAARARSSPSWQRLEGSCGALLRSAPLSPHAHKRRAPPRTTEAARWSLS